MKIRKIDMLRISQWKLAEKFKKLLSQSSDYNSYSQDLKTLTDKFMNKTVEKYSGKGIPNITNRSDPKSKTEVTKEEWEWMCANWPRCPDCGWELHGGPEGGGSQNCPCSNPECRSEFNHGGFYAHRNGKMSEGRRKWYEIPNVSIAISEFAQKRHNPTSGYSYFLGNDTELIELINAHWNDRYPGQGRNDLEKVVVVPLPPDDFIGKTIPLTEDTPVTAKVTKRQDGEDLYVKVSVTDKISGWKINKHYNSWVAPIVWTISRSTATGSEYLTIHKTVSDVEFLFADEKKANDILSEYIEENKPKFKYAKAVLYSAAALEENNGKRSSDANWEVVALIVSNEENEPMHPLTMARNFLKKPGGTYTPYTAEQFAESIYYWSTKIGVE